MAVTVGELKRMLSVKRDSDILCVNDVIIDKAIFNNEHNIPMAIDLELFGDKEMNKDEVRKTRLRAVGVNVK